ncbi:hypothetical protein HNQ38_000124 [Desulfovibrio intestinalis]|uniref:Uncharacterized protein n=1 Tax=Desulfovibrio intestinalis TaxID=58621 RepID=A0A7W8BY31_9BACT|nr:hypothetical protein [Desulfovibrio intestinalis]
MAHIVEAAARKSLLPGLHPQSSLFFQGAGATGPYCEFSGSGVFGGSLKTPLIRWSEKKAVAGLP